jgi:hypothetical protein
MKFGFFFDHYNDCSYILYMLQNFKVVSMSHHPITIEIEDNQNNIFILSQSLYNLISCDKIFHLFNYWENKKQSPIFINEATGSVDVISIYVSPGENVPLRVTDQMLKQFLDEGNIFISSSTISFEHNNVIRDYALNMYHFYHLYGYSFLNFYPTTEKNNLIGLYYQDKHLNGLPIKYRVELYQKTKEIIKDDMHVYEWGGLQKQNYPVDMIVGLNYFKEWHKNFVTTYTDYNTSVCNILFETLTVLDEEYCIRDHITEKTLKFLLFSGQCKIFFIWVGSPKQYEFLKSNDFWALNFEFIPENPSREDIFASVEKSALYLKSLKDSLIHNNVVYSHLLSKYENHLLKNKQQLTHILNNCSASTQGKLLNLIKSI